VVRDTTDRSASIERVAGAAAELGLGVQGITASPLPGPAGNVEYFLWLRRGAPPLDQEQLRRAIAEGPSGVRADREEREDEESSRAERTSPRGKRS
jgi:23S rRNA (cytidine1920-2'-O)/16S rRNA (cytidine1409-2'-O)-methyltransferase